MALCHVRSGALLRSTACQGESLSRGGENEAEVQKMVFCADNRPSITDMEFSFGLGPGDYQSRRHPGRRWEHARWIRWSYSHRPDNGSPDGSVCTWIFSRACRNSYRG